MANAEIDKVKEFMNFFNQEVQNTPTIPSVEVRRLRAKLILEEALETIEALGFDVKLNHEEFVVVWTDREPNLVKIADGLCDLHYVGYTGTALACGLQDHIDACFNEVHRSNMSKAWTIKNVEEHKHIFPTAKIEYYDGGLYRFLVEGKVIKSPTYSPADLKTILHPYAE